jgi:hypothetical protein
MRNDYLIYLQVERKNGVVKLAIYAKVNEKIEAGESHWDIVDIANNAIHIENGMETHRHGFSPIQLLRGLQSDMKTPFEDRDAVYAEVGTRRLVHVRIDLCLVIGVFYNTGNGVLIYMALWGDARDGANPRYRGFEVSNICAPTPCQVLETMVHQGDKAIKRDLARSAKRGRMERMELNMRVLVRNRKRKIGGGPPVDQWSCRAVIKHLKTTEEGVERAIVRWLTHGPRVADVSGTQSRWLLVTRDIRRDKSKSAMAHVEQLSSLMTRRLAGKGEVEVIEVGTLLDIPKREWFVSAKDQQSFFGNKDIHDKIRGVVGGRTDCGRYWEVFTDSGGLELTDNKVIAYAVEGFGKGRMKEEMGMDNDDDPASTPTQLTNTRTRRKSKEPTSNPGRKSKRRKVRGKNEWRHGLQLWPWRENSCHLDTFLACLTSILSFTNTRGIHLLSLNPTLVQTEDVAIATAYWEAAKEVLTDFEGCDYGRKVDDQVHIVDLTRDNLRERLTTPKMSKSGKEILLFLEDNQGMGELRDHIALLAKCTRTTSSTTPTGRAFRRDFALEQVVEKWCVRRHVPPGSSLIPDGLPAGTDLRQVRIGNPACRSRIPSFHLVQHSRAVPLDGYRHHPPLPHPDTPDTAREEYVAPETFAMNGGTDPSTFHRYDLASQALRASLYGTSFAGSCDTVDATDPGKQRCQGAVFVRPAMQQRYALFSVTIQNPVNGVFGLLLHSPVTGFQCFFHCFGICFPVTGVSVHRLLNSMQLPTVLHLQHNDGRYDDLAARHVKVSERLNIAGATYQLVFVTYYRGRHFCGQGYVFQRHTLKKNRGRHRWYKYNDRHNSGRAYFNDQDEFDHEHDKGNVYTTTYVRTDDGAGSGIGMTETREDILEDRRVRIGASPLVGLAMSERRIANRGWSKRPNLEADTIDD